MDGPAVDDGLGVDEKFVVGSLQPNHPGVLHEVLGVTVMVVVTTVVGAGTGLGVLTVPEVVVVGSLHPNQPGVLHVDVELVEVLLVVVVVVVVVSSKQPHHPGVLQVSVRVLVNVVVLLLLVVVSVPLLSKNFQLKQSMHSVSSLHSGTVSYLSKTSLMTLLMLCVPTPTLHPRSSTVS